MEKIPDLTQGDLAGMCREVRRDIVEMVWRSGGGHIGGSLSVVEILVALYFSILRMRPEEPDWEDRDRLILSKGHAAAALYAVMARRGCFPREKLFTEYIKAGGALQEHPDMRTLPGIEISGGSLGQGLSVGVGIALGLRMKGKQARTYVVVGDGELNEGESWEAAMAASHFHLGSLTAVVDNNGFGVNAPVSELMGIEPLEDKWRAFGWKVERVGGHSINSLLGAFGRAGESAEGTPLAIIADTVKGKGVSFMEGQAAFHACTLSEEQYSRALKELS